ncbi:thiamine pyrophosphate-dependent enzyme [Streptomyces sp. NPDC057027]|uniref:thiamine pyrophosphate-dependent enzyme n=1 Tax=Streptomyces sp. NPDC057027 TaxID=3346004 RepID=UPI00362E5B22
MTTSVSCSHPSPTARPARSARHCSGSATWWTSHPATRPDTVAARAAAVGRGGGVRLRPSRAKSAHPDRPGIAIVGDGAMQMNGLAEPITAAKYHREWSDPRLVVAVLDNQDLDQVAWEMRPMRGAPQFEPSQGLPDVRHADIAQLLGPHGVRVERPEDPEGEEPGVPARRTELSGGHRSARLRLHADVRGGRPAREVIPASGRG